MTTPRTFLSNDPRLPEILDDYRAGVALSEMAKKYGYTNLQLSNFRYKNSDRYGLDTQAAQKVRVQEHARITEKTAAEAEKAASAEFEHKVSELQLQIEDYKSRFADLEGLYDALNIMNSNKVDPPVWLAPAKAEEKHGTVCAVLSDLHLDEVVRKQEVGGVNAFNRRIAEQRLKRFFEKAVELPRDYLSNIEYDGFVLMCLGDTFTGEIHEELAVTNEGHPFETALHFIDYFVAGIRLLVEHYGKVHVVSVPGNHDRTYKKPRYKGRVVTSMHYLFMKFVEREFAGDDRVTFQAPETPDAVVKVYDTTYLCTHGDQFKGGNGVGGIMVPLLRGHLKTQQRQQAIRQGYDVMVMGHWHQYLAVPSSGLIINGSLKGYDEFAYGHGFNYEPAQQALWVTTPEHGATGFHLPIVVQDKKNERW
jgi:hypothetical protein